MAGNDETMKVFTCPYCRARFQAAIDSSPKAYRCPHCREPFTVYPDGDIQKGDRTRPRPTIEPVRSPAEVFSEGRSAGEGRADRSGKECIENEEKALYMEVLEQFKELNSMQRSHGEADAQASELKRLRKENERLMGNIFALEEHLKALTGGSTMDIPMAPVHAAIDGSDDLRAENEKLRSILEEQRRLLDESELTKLEMGNRIDELERIVSRERTEAGQGQNDRSIMVSGDRASLTSGEDLEAESEKLSIWRKELDDYKANLEDIALSLVKEKEALEKRNIEVTRKEKAIRELSGRERRIEEMERSLLKREEELRSQVRKVPREQDGGSDKGQGHRTLSERERLLAEKEVELRELERSLTERHEALAKARDRLKELKERMDRELGAGRHPEETRSRQRELKEKLESKQVGFQELETKLKDLLK